MNADPAARSAQTRIYWFRNDLRLDDNPALRAALDADLTPIPVYIHAPDEHGDWAPGAASDNPEPRNLATMRVAMNQDSAFCVQGHWGAGHRLKGRRGLWQSGQYNQNGKTIAGHSTATWQRSAERWQRARRVPAKSLIAANSQGALQ